MLVMVLIGWTVVLPVLVVAGLYGSARLLGARARRGGEMAAVTQGLEELVLCDAQPVRTPMSKDVADSSLTLGVRL